MLAGFSVLVTFYFSVIVIFSFWSPVDYQCCPTCWLFQCGPQLGLTLRLLNILKLKLLLGNFCDSVPTTNLKIAYSIQSQISR